MTTKRMTRLTLVSLARRGAAEKHAATLVGGGALGVGFLGLAFLGEDARAPRGVPLLAAAGAVLAFGNAFVGPSVTAVLSRYAGKSQGRVLGLSQGLQALARTIGPIIFGAVYERSTKLPFLIAGGAALVSAVLSFVTLKLNRRLPESRRKRASLAAAAAAAAPPDGAIELEMPPAQDIAVIEEGAAAELARLRAENAELRALLARQPPSVSPLHGDGKGGSAADAALPPRASRSSSAPAVPEAWSMLETFTDVGQSIAVGQHRA